MHPGEALQFGLVTPKGKSTATAETSVTAAKDGLLTANLKLNRNERELCSADTAVKSLHLFNISTEIRNPHFQSNSFEPDQNSAPSEIGSQHTNDKASVNYPGKANQECSGEELTCNCPKLEATNDTGSSIIAEYGNAFLDERLSEIESLSADVQVRGTCTSRTAAVSNVGHDTLISNQNSGAGDVRQPISQVAPAKLSRTIR